MTKKTSKQTAATESLISDEMFINALKQVGELTTSQRQHAIVLTRMIMDYEKREQYSAEDILTIFEQALASIKDNAGIDELMDLMLRPEA